MKDSIKILLVEDSEFDLEAILRILRREYREVKYKHVYSRKAFIEALNETFDMVICDHKLPDFDSFDAFDLMVERGLETPFIIISGAITEERAAQTLKRGTADFLSKNSLKRLGSATREALHNKKLRDINRKAEEELRETQDRLRLAIESTNLGTWDYLPLENKLTWCERAWQAHGRQRCDEIDIESFLQMVDEADRARIRGEINQAMAQGSQGEEFSTLYKVKNSEHWLSLRGKINRNTEGVATRFTGVILDITDSKVREQKLEDERNASDSANKAKSTFLANMSHEIRTPLGAMIGYGELLNGEDIPERERKQFVETIIRNGRELTRLIDDILDLSKVEEGRLDFERTNFSLRDLLRDVTSSLAIKAREKNLGFILEVADSLPRLISNDPLRLRQVLMNILEAIS